jgi:hypothetical protein
MKTRIAMLSAVCLATISTAHAVTLDFEDLVLSPSTYWKGPDPLGTDQSTPWGTTERVGSFTSGGAKFGNVYDLTYGSWYGWAYSNTTDVVTPGVVNGIVVNESSAYDPHHLADGGGDNSANYAVTFSTAFGGSAITLPAGMQPVSMRVANTTYAALIMRDGDPSGFAKKFGFGDDRSTPDIAETNQPDWFLLKVIGLDAGNQQIGSVDFYLADYRFANDADDYVVDEWKTIDLSSLAGAAKLNFALSSSDVGGFGMNTPDYFALDNLVLQPVPEPATFVTAAIAAVGLLTFARSRRAA